MEGVDQKLMQRRLNLEKFQYLCERFERSPNITDEYSVAPHLRIEYASRDVSILSSIAEILLKDYEHVKNWFGFRGDLAIDLWMAPEIADLEYITGMRCADGYMCAPGARNGGNVIPFVSPLASTKNADRMHFSAVLAHEITHYFISNISQATIFHMKRKESGDLPLWLEEGLCQLVSSEVNPSFAVKWDEEITEVDTWHPLEDLWNDLSACENATIGYLQAYKETRDVVKRRGKAEIIALLYLNRTHYVEWTDLTREGEVSMRVKHAKDERP